MSHKLISKKNNLVSSCQDVTKAIVTSFKQEYVAENTTGPIKIKQQYKIENHYTTINQVILNRALNTRLCCTSGFDSYNVSCNNSNATPKFVLDFWNNYNFEIPNWLSEIVYKTSNKMTLNKFEYHPQANIDPICAHLFEREAPGNIGVFHLNIQLCIFSKFVEFVNENSNAFTLLKYGCVCDCFGVLHVHMIAVSNIDINCITTLLNKTTCHVNEELMKFRNKIDRARVVPSFWPLHLHFKADEIASGWDLFCTIETLCQRSISNLFQESAILPIMLKDIYFVINKGPRTSSLENSFIQFLSKNFPYLSSGELQRNGRNCHIYIFRSITNFAPLWFSALTSKGAVDYLQRFMHNKSIITKCNEVFDNESPKILYNALLDFLPLAALPLPEDRFIYHQACPSSNGTKRVLKNEYLNLGQGRYIYMSKYDDSEGVSKRCCTSFLPDLLVLACNHLTYELNEMQRQEYRSFVFWTNINKLNFINTCKDWDIILSTKC